jgi:hypothetical protein
MGYTLDWFDLLFFLLLSSYPFSFFLGDAVSYILIIPSDEILIGFHGNGSQELCGSNGKLERAWKEWKTGIGASKVANASKQYNQPACPLFHQQLISIEA